jgi:hypothetical protein
MDWWMSRCRGKKMGKGLLGQFKNERNRYFSVASFKTCVYFKHSKSKKVKLFAANKFC